LSASSQPSHGGARRPGVTTAHPPEADEFEREYPGSRWLDMRVTRQLRLAGTQVDALIANITRRYGLSPAAVNALAVIEGVGHPVPAGEISAGMHVTTATMTTVLDTLERKGYIRRQPDLTDRRRVLIDITPDAQALLDRILPEIQQLSTAALSPLGDETLVSLLEALTAANDALAGVPRDLPPPPARRTPPRLQRPPLPGQQPAAELSGSDRSASQPG
jgi:DNA-binding MarR family transcriptional regulator